MTTRYLQPRIAFAACRRIWLIAILIMLTGCLPSTEQSHLHGTQTSQSFGISGYVHDNHGLPAAGAYVYAYRNMKSHLRGPADFEAVVDSDGTYFLDLVEGDFYLVARMSQTGADAGPPRAGDAWALPKKNPVTVAYGETTRVDFVLQGVVQPMLMREGTLTSGDTGFTGILVDESDNPLAGSFVIAYPDTDFQRMPEATSPAVGEDGRFHLYVDREGQWCLAARTRTRGQPIAGEPYGLLGEGNKACRTATKGQVLDVGVIHLSPYRQ
jgi:hypothetical protein